MSTEEIFELWNKDCKIDPSELDHHLHEYINKNVKVNKLDDMDFYNEDIGECDEEKLLKELLDFDE